MKERESGSRRRPISADTRVRSVAPGNSVRLRIFYNLLPNISAFFRRRRMKAFSEVLAIEPGMRVLDLGGAPAIWEHLTTPVNVTLLNLPGAVSEGELEILDSPSLQHHTFHVVEGDACNVTQFDDGSFDLVFSNSVIEHVGPPDMQAKFAREVQRLGKSYWVQTPSKWFPIEAHSGLPFFWFYPGWLRAAVMSNWRKRLPEWWTEYISTTRVLTHRRMSELFPGGETKVEYFLGFPKSYISHLRSS